MTGKAQSELLIDSEVFNGLENTRQKCNLWFLTLNPSFILGEHIIYDNLLVVTEEVLGGSYTQNFDKLLARLKNRGLDKKLAHFFAIQNQIKILQV